MMPSIAVFTAATLGLFWKPLAAGTPCALLLAATLGLSLTPSLIPAFSAATLGPFCMSFASGIPCALFSTATLGLSLTPSLITAFSSATLGSFGRSSITCGSCTWSLTTMSWTTPPGTPSPPPAFAWSLTQASYWAWSVCVKRVRVEERNRFVNQLPLANLAFTLPSTNVTSKVLWLTWILPFLGAAPCADRKWSWNEMSRMCWTEGSGMGSFPGSRDPLRLV